MRRLKQIEDDLSALRSSILAPREKEYKQQVVKYVQKAFRDFSTTEISNKIDCMNDIEVCSKRKFCQKILRSHIEAASMSYLHGDLDSSNTTLDAVEDRVRGMSEDCETGTCRNYALGLISEVRSVLMLAKGIENDCMMAVPQVEERSNLELDTVNASGALSALAHPARLDILSKLEKSELGFSELSKDLHLRTGHLQYHLKVLDSEGYVRKDRRGLYSITLQGLTALEGLRSLMLDLNELVQT